MPLKKNNPDIVDEVDENWGTLYCMLQNAHANPDIKGAADLLNSLRTRIRVVAEGVPKGELRRDPFLQNWGVFSPGFKGGWSTLFKDDKPAFQRQLNLACGGDGKSTNLPPSEKAQEFVIGNLRRLRLMHQRSPMPPMDF